MSAELDLSKIEVLDGAGECVAAGVLSSIHSQNAKAAAAVTNAKEAIQLESWPLMVDPQTGPILISQMLLMFQSALAL